MAWTFAQIQQKVLGWLDDTGDTDRMLAMCKQAIADANIARATEYPWPFMRSTATLAPVSAGSKIYALPGDYYRPLYMWDTSTKSYATEVSMRGLQLTGPEPSVSPWPVGHGYGVTLPFYFDQTTVTSGSPPVTEARRSLVFIGDTVPSTLSCVYYRQPRDLSADADLPDLPWPHAQLLVWDAVLDLKAYASESPELIPYWSKKQREALQRLYESQKGDQALGAWGSYVHPSEV